MQRYVPDRKILATGLTGLIGWLAVMVAQQFGVPLSLETATGIVGSLMLLAGYLTPPSVQDILKRVDETIIGLAEKR